jgi:hypothetical protein
MGDKSSKGIIISSLSFFGDLTVFCVLVLLCCLVQDDTDHLLHFLPSQHPRPLPLGQPQNCAFSFYPTCL